MTLSRSNRRRWLLECVILSLLCFSAYGVGLTQHGLTNWQEAQRALVAREMHARDEWIVPTVHGKPYLAKPPLIYWTQLGLAKAMGQTPSELHLRLSVAIAGWLGVMLTYAAAWLLLPVASRHALRDQGEATVERDHKPNAWWRFTPAFWAAAVLSTGFLYVRSSRIGELDILLAPTCVAAIACMAQARRASTPWWPSRTLWLTAATIAASLAALAKGPPALLVIAIATIVGPALHAAWIGFATEVMSVLERYLRGATFLPSDLLVKDGRADAHAPHPLRVYGSLVIAGTIGGLMMVAIAIWASGWSLLSFDGILALLLWYATGEAIGMTVVRLRAKARFHALAMSLWRMQPWVVLFLALVPSWLWVQGVAKKIGWDALNNAKNAEAADNLRLFVPESPLNNLEASSFGVGLGSIAAMGMLIWLVRERPRLRPGGWILLAWVVGGFIAFSTLGKGVGRYLTPLWPGMALLGGAGMAMALASLRPRGQRRISTILLGVLAAMAGAQGWWYGHGMESRYADRSPRAMMGEIKALGHVDEVALLDFSTPAVDYYLGDQAVVLAGPNAPTARSFEGWCRERANIPDRAIALARANAAERFQPEPMALMGLRATLIPLQTKFSIDNGRAQIQAWAIEPLGNTPR